MQVESFFSWASRTFLVTAVIALGGCASLPAHGPSTQAIVGDQKPSETIDVAMEYELVTLTAESAKRHGARPPERFSATTRSRTIRTNRDVIAEGDGLSIRIWEAGEEGLFSTAEQRDTEILVTVASDGTVRVPYAGQVTARGKSLEDLRADLLEAVSGKALEPEIQVSRLQSDALSVSVLGDVNRPGRIELPTQSASLLDVIALAGGQSQPAWETRVTLVRGSRRETIRLDSAFDVAANNVAILPGDTVHLEFAPRYFSAFGAVTKSGEQRLAKPRVTLAGAIANAGGLRDSQADPASIFLFRFEDKAQFGALTPEQRAKLVGDKLPVIYRLDMSRADAFFLAKIFEIDDGDILYVANAQASELRKFVITLLSPVLASSNAANNLRD